MSLELYRETLATPIGKLILLCDTQANVRALDWWDFDERMHRLLDRQYAKGGWKMLDAAGESAALRALRAYFGGDLHALVALAVVTAGSPFQQSVWSGLRAIPVGQAWSYARLAEHLGCAGSARAVGSANGANPVGLILPCHRVIGANGQLTGYAGGSASAGCSNTKGCCRGPCAGTAMQGGGCPERLVLSEVDWKILDRCHDRRHSGRHIQQPAQ